MTRLDGKSTETSLDPKKTEYTEFLLQAMEQRLELLQSLQELGRSQAEAAKHAEIEATLGILGRKQLLLDELAAIREKLQPFFEDDPDARNWVSPQRRQHCREVAEEGNRLLREAASRDLAAIQEMTDRRDAVAAQLQDGTDSILASTAYTADSVLHSGALDIQDV